MGATAATAIAAPLTLSHTPARSLQASQSLAESLLYDEGEDDDDAAAGQGAGRGSAGRSSTSVSLQELRAALLDADLRKTGAGCLPEDVNRANSSSIKGPMVLQVCAGVQRLGGAVGVGGLCLLMCHACSCRGNGDCVAVVTAAH